jgi:multidrug efflux pump
MVEGRLAALPRFFDRMGEAYAAALERVLARRTLTMLVFAGSVVLTGVLAWGIPKDLFPQQDGGQIQAIFQADQTSSLPPWVILRSVCRTSCGAIRRWPASLQMSGSMGRTARLRRDA